MHCNIFEKHWSYIILELQYLTTIIQMIITKKCFCRFLIFSFFKNFAPIDYWGGRRQGVWISLNSVWIWKRNDIVWNLGKKEEFTWGCHPISKTLCWNFKFKILRIQWTIPSITPPIQFFQSNVSHEHIFTKNLINSLHKYQSCHHIETSQFISSPNQLTGFYIWQLWRLMS